jgi:PAS domain S-box-containing protein
MNRPDQDESMASRDDAVMNPSRGEKSELGTWLAAPTPPDEGARRDRLAMLGLALGQRHPVLDELTALASGVLGAPIALVSLVESRRQTFLSRHGLDATSTGRDESFCGHAVLGAELFEVPDAHADPRFAENPLVVGAPHVGAYLGVPLLTQPGQSAIGTLCVFDHTPRRWSVQDHQNLSRIASIVEDYLLSLSSRRVWHDSPLSLLVVARTGIIQSANPAFGRLVGRPVEHLVGRALGDWVVSVDRGVVDAMIVRTLSSRESPTRRELRFVRLSGETVTGGVSMSPLVDTRDHVVCAIRDISLERRAAALTEVAGEVRREFELPIEEARAALARVRARAAAACIDDIAAVEARLQRVEGLLDARAGDVAGRASAEAEARESQQRLRAVVERVLEPLLVIDERGLVADANEVALTALGWARAELVGASMREVCPRFSEAERQRWVARGETDDARDEPWSATFVRRDGRELHVLLRAVVMRWNGPRRLVLIATDVTAARAREARLVEERDGLAADVRAHAEALRERHAMEEALERSLREKETLLKEIHHRVKNNLQVVSSLLHLQMSRIASVEARAAIAESANRVLSMALIHQQLYGSATFERVDLRAYTERLAHALRYTLAPSSDLDIQADPVGLDVERAVPVGLILNELLTNAFKYGHPSSGVPGEVRVEIRAGDGSVRVVVRDRGPGLPPGFDLRRGSTLGMRLMQSLARQLSGTLTARSEGGAVFELTFTP